MDNINDNNIPTIIHRVIIQGHIIVYRNINSGTYYNKQKTAAVGILSELN